MNIEQILTDEQIIGILEENRPEHDGLDKAIAVSRAIEQAVLQSPEIQEMRNAHDVLIRNGFVQCDISACNCGSWHARYGYPERMREIKDALSESGHPLSNDNGNLAINALNDLISESQALRKDAERYRYLKKGNQWSVAATQTGFHVDGEDLDDLIDSEMEQQHD